MLKLINIHKSFGDQKVLDGINLEIEKGLIYTLIGTNGSGKTTLFNIITGFIKPDIGKIILNDINILNLSPSSVNLAGISRTFQNVRLINELTVKNNLLLAMKNNPGEKVINSLLPSLLFRKKKLKFEKNALNALDLINLNKEANRKPNELSYGQQKLLELGCCLVNEGDIFLLDEPVAGVNLVLMENIQKILNDLRNKGKTIFIIEHNSDFIRKISDKIFFLSSGKITTFDNYDQFKNDRYVQNTYL